ncbi:hypothetical protein BDA96_06G304100 [Sorghum bicolor]|uniref:RNase H type-1 domain-containing protein n=2 Tax=Sorghum bicolor TaxID=4558 RepID=A0A921QWW2_SORBI|nr:hypothetical protein BDA96_06G304100 [Sorghum bicolor]OQU82641.1 hypothetical protein SORBI_3006G279800 [Sorghum bicolor]
MAFFFVWWTVLSVLGADASPVGDVTILVWWDRWRARWHGERQKGADTLFALVAWEIWKERNARCFRHTSSNITQLLSIIRANADLWIQGGARHLGCLIRE